MPLTIRHFLKRVATILVDLYALMQRFSFPTKYSWKWKLEMLLQRYEPETTRLVRDLLKPGMTFIDIGAHIGYFTRLAAQRVGEEGHVYAFEPDAKNRALLVENTKRFGNVMVRDEAVTDHDGVVAFYRVRESTGCHSTIAQNDAERSEVPAMKLDTFAAQNKTQKIDIIKMDVEGGEWNALSGMMNTLRSVRHLVIEYNPDALLRANADSEKLLRTLREKGFSISLLCRGAELPLSDSLDIHSYLTDGSVNLHCYKV